MYQYNYIVNLQELHQLDYQKHRRMSTLYLLEQLELHCHNHLRSQLRQAKLQLLEDRLAMYFMSSFFA